MPEATFEQLAEIALHQQTIYQKVLERTLDPAYVLDVLRALTADRPHSGRVISRGNVRIDLDGHEVYIDSKPIHLTPTEFRVLSLFMRQPPGTVLEYGFLEQSIWTEPVDDEKNTQGLLKKYISRLRRCGIPIKNKHGIGYRLEVPLSSSRKEEA